MNTENTSGLGKTAIIPAEINHWNWGAFLLNWIWGLGHNTHIALLMFVPFVNFVMPFVLGAKGSGWAWQNKRWESVEQFQAMQAKWTKWGIIVYVVWALLMVAFSAVLFYLISSTFKNSEPYKLAQAQIQQNAQVQSALGTPISTGFAMGSIEQSGPNGEAHLQFSVEGPRGDGTAYVMADKEMGVWRIKRLAMDEETSGRRIELAP